MGERIESGAPAKQTEGKKRQRFTKRDVARAISAAPDRTVIVRPDGAIELRPCAGGGVHEQKNPLDRLLHDSDEDGTA